LFYYDYQIQYHNSIIKIYNHHHYS